MAFKMKKNKPGSLYKKAVYKNSNVYKLRTDNEEDMIKVSIPSVDIEGGEGGRYTTSYDFPYFYNKQLCHSFLQILWNSYLFFCPLQI